MHYCYYNIDYCEEFYEIFKRCVQIVFIILQTQYEIVYIGYVLRLFDGHD